jgi:hypothetical protein
MYGQPPEALQAYDLVFLAGFKLEALISLLAMAVVAAHNTYLRNGWNCLYLLIIATGYLSLASNMTLLSRNVLLRMVAPAIRL